MYLQLIVYYDKKRNLAKLNFYMHTWLFFKGTCRHDFRVNGFWRVWRYSHGGLQGSLYQLVIFLLIHHLFFQFLCITSHSVSANFDALFIYQQYSLCTRQCIRKALRQNGKQKKTQLYGTFSQVSTNPIKYCVFTNCDESCEEGRRISRAL